MKNFLRFFLFPAILFLLVNENVLAQITLVPGSGTNAAIVGSTITIDRPSGLAENDIMFANIVQGDNDNNPISLDASRSGWLLVDGAILGSSGNNHWRGTILYRIADAGDVAASNFQFTLDPGVNNDGAAGGIVAFRNVDVSTGPFDVAPGSINVPGSTGSVVTANTITTSSPGAAIVMFAMAGDNNSFTNTSWTTATSPLTLTEILQRTTTSGPDESVGIGWERKGYAGGTGNGTVTMSGTDFRGGLLVALKPLPLPTLTSIGCTSQYFVSHGTDGTYDGNTLLDDLGFTGGGAITISPFALDDGAPGTIGFNSMGLNPIDGFIYAVRYPVSTSGTAPQQQPHLIKIGTAGSLNQIDLGPIEGASPNVRSYGGCFDANGDFYFTQTDGRFMKILSPASSPLIAVELNLSGYGDIVDLAISPVTGQMYGVSTASSNYLYTIDKMTGVLTTPGVGVDMGGALYFAALFFDEVGELYGYRSGGNMYLLDKITGGLSLAGDGAAFDFADGCACSFGRVFHRINPRAVICPDGVTPNPIFDITISTTNQSPTQKTGLTFTLDIPGNRFSFIQSPTTIATNMEAAGLLPSATPGFVTISSTTGTNNKIVVTSFQTGGAAAILDFNLELQLVTLGGTYSPVPLQSVISGLPVAIGTTDLSNNPSTPAPDDPTNLTFCPIITLPASIINFTGIYQNDNAKLNWEVAQEINLDRYEIERSSNGADFVRVGSVRGVGGSGTNSYRYNDDLSSVYNPVFNYRLKIVDIDGKYTYSNVILIRKDGKYSNINVSPNPVKQGAIPTIQVAVNENGTGTFRVTDMAGRTLLMQKNNLQQGVNSISLNNINRLQSGMYMIHFSVDGQVMSTKLIIN